MVFGFFFYFLLGWAAGLPWNMKVSSWLRDSGVSIFQRWMKMGKWQRLWGAVCAPCAPPCCTNASSVYLFNTIFTFHNSSRAGFSESGQESEWAVAIRMRSLALGSHHSEVLSPPWCLMFPVLFATCNWLFRATCGFSSAAFLCSSNVSGKRCLGSSSEATTLKSTQQIIASESFALPSRNYSSFASPGRSRIRRGGPLMAQLMMRLMGVASLPFERFCGKNLCVCLRFEESLHGGKHFQG